MRSSSRPEADRVTQLLATLPEPDPMPDELSARILARLRHEAQLPQPVKTPWWQQRRNQIAATIAGLTTAAAGSAVLAVGGPGQVAASLGLSAPTSRASAALTPSTASSVTPETTAITASGRAWTSAKAQKLDIERFTASEPTLPPLAANAQSMGPLASAVGAASCFTEVTGHAPQGNLLVDLGTVNGHPGALIAAGTSATGYQLVLVSKPCTKVDVLTQDAASR